MNKRKGGTDSDIAIRLVVILIFGIIVISIIGFPLYFSHVNYQNQTLKTILDNIDINEYLYSIELTDEELIIRKKDEYQDTELRTIDSNDAKIRYFDSSPIKSITVGKELQKLNVTFKDFVKEIRSLNEFNKMVYEDRE